MQAILVEVTRLAGHIFWPDSLSILDKSMFRLAGAGPRNITDIYLIGLATFDRSIASDHVIGSEPGVIELIAP